jgi:hypothetical protein
MRGNLFASHLPFFLSTRLGDSSVLRENALLTFLHLERQQLSTRTLTPGIRSNKAGGQFIAYQSAGSQTKSHYSPFLQPHFQTTTFTTFLNLPVLPYCPSAFTSLNSYDYVPNNILRETHR